MFFLTWNFHSNFWQFSQMICHRLFHWAMLAKLFDYSYQQLYNTVYNNIATWYDCNIRYCTIILPICTIVWKGSSWTIILTCISLSSYSHYSDLRIHETVGTTVPGYDYSLYTVDKKNTVVVKLLTATQINVGLCYLVLKYHMQAR